MAPDHHATALETIQRCGFFFGLWRGDTAVPHFDDTYCHPGRRPDVRVLTIRLRKEALAIVREECPEGTRHIGEFFDQLLFEHRARKEERQRLREYLDGGSLVK